MHAGFPKAGAEEGQPVHHVVLEEERAEVCYQEDKGRNKEVKGDHDFQIDWVGAI